MFLVLHVAVPTCGSSKYHFPLALRMQVYSLYRLALRASSASGGNLTAPCEILFAKPTCLVFTDAEGH